MANALKMMDESVMNIMKGKASNALDLRNLGIKGCTM